MFTDVYYPHPRTGAPFRGHSLRAGDYARTLSGPAFKVESPVDLANGRERLTAWTEEGRNSKRTWIHGSAEVYALNPDRAENWARTRPNATKPFRNWRNVRLCNWRMSGPEGVGWTVRRLIPRDEYEGRDLPPVYEVRMIGMPRNPDGSRSPGSFGAKTFSTAAEALRVIADWYAHRRLDEKPDLMTPVTLRDCAIW